MAPHWLAPAGSGIAELGVEHIVVCHGEKAEVDLAFLAPTDAIHGRLHIIVDPTPGHATEDPEGVPMGIEQHLMCL